MFSDCEKLLCLRYIQEYGLDIFFLQVWKDVRLAQGQDRNLSFFFSGEDIKKIWTPDTYFMNAKQVTRSECS